MLKVDLHCHSTASDGALAPRDLLLAAAEAGVELLALTDHDTLDGYFALTAGDEQSTLAPGLRLLPGVEFSCVFSCCLTRKRVTSDVSVEKRCERDNSERLLRDVISGCATRRTLASSCRNSPASMLEISVKVLTQFT